MRADVFVLDNNGKFADCTTATADAAQLVRVLMLEIAGKHLLSA